MNTLDEVKIYYGQTLQSSADLKTDACCTPDAMPDFVRSALADIHPEVLSRYYGCGLVVPDELAGLKVLDLGSGSGRDVYLLSRLVGEQGSVVGVDMTTEQLDVANRHIDYHAEKIGYQKSNVRFVQGDLQELDSLGLEPGSFDLVISNCVINLVPDKEAVLRAVHSLLKPGGEIYFSDVYADRRVPDDVRNDPVLYGECLGGALYWNDFERIARAAGFADPRLVEDRPLSIDSAEQRAKIGNIKFYSATYRLFKLSGLEPACEDYGQAVRYLGSLPQAPDSFVLDKHHRIETGRMFPVCGNTWRMLQDSRFAPHFEFYGDFSRHYGIFEDGGVDVPFDDETADTGSSTAAGSSGCC